MYSLAAANPGNSYKEVLAKSFNGVHPPLFHTLLWLWFKVFGFSELSGRVFPAMFGIFTIPVMYLLGKELFDGEVGVYAAGIATLNPFLLHYSQEVRPYSLFLLLSLLSLFLYLKVLKHLRYRDFAFYLVISGALIYTHYFGLLVVAVEALFLAVYIPSNRHKIRKTIAFAASTMFTLILFILPVLLWIIADASRNSFWIGRPESDFIIDYIDIYFGKNSLVIIFIISLIIIALSQIAYDTENREKNLSINFLAIWIIVLITVPYIVSIIFVPVLIPRNVIIILPAIILFISVGIKSVAIKEFRFIIFIVLIVLSVINIFYEKNYYKKVSKEQFSFLINNVIKKNKYIPVYSEESTNGVNAYASLLGYEKEIKSINETDVLNDLDKQGGCFFILERNHRFNIGEIDTFIENYDLRIVRKVVKKGASAFLLTRDHTSEYPCVKTNRD